MTNANAIASLWKSKGNRDIVRLFPTTGKTFHPKLYMFECPDGWEVLVGSANMTAAAFAENYEAMVYLRPSTAEMKGWLAAWKQWWDVCPPLTAQNLSEYSKVAAKWTYVPVQRVLERNDLEIRGASTAVPYVADADSGNNPLPRFSDALDYEFPKYISELRRRLLGFGWADGYLDSSVDEHSNYLSVIERGNEILRTLNFPDPSEREKFQVILGTRKDTGWLGSLSALRTGWHTLKSPQFIAQLRIRIAPLITAQTDDEILAAAKDIFAFIHAHPGLSNAVSTRILALARPDRFFSVNSSSKPNLARLFGISTRELETWGGYSRALQVVWTARWYLSPEPSDTLMSRLWGGRVALLDALVYEKRE